MSANRSPVVGSSVWGRDDYGPDRAWSRPLPAALIDDMERALPKLKALGLHPKDIRPEHFPLPNGEGFLQEIREAVDAEPGFALMTGFPIDRFEEADAKLAYVGMMSRFGHIAIQNRIGEYVIDVADRGRGLGPQARGHYGNKALSFHADGANAVSLLCLTTAPEGGQSLLVSGPALYNAIREERPDLLAALERGFHHHRRDEREPDDPIYTPWRTPVFAFYDDLFHIIYTRFSIDYCEAEGVLLTDGEREALDYLDSIIARPEMQVSMDLTPGDVQIVNNFLVLHSRTAYRDDPAKPRRLVRLWLDDPASRRNGPGKMDWYMPEHSRFLKERGRLLEGYLES